MDDIKYLIMFKIEEVLKTLTDQEVRILAKLLSVDNLETQSVNTLEVGISSQEQESLKLIDKHTGDTAIQDVETMVKNEVPPANILETLVNDAGDEKSQLIRTITSAGFSLKTGTDYTVELLRQIVGEIQKASGETIKREPPPHPSPGAKGVPNIPGVIPAPPKKEEKFDYSKVHVEKKVVSEDVLNDRINELITKIGGEKLSDESLLLISDWNQKYSPSQIHNCLNRSWSQSAFTLKHTDGLLKSTFPPPAPQNEQGDMPAKVGKFRLDRG